MILYISIAIKAVSTCVLCLHHSQVEIYEVMATSGQLTWEEIAFVHVLIAKNTFGRQLGCLTSVEGT